MKVLHQQWKITLWVTGALWVTKDCPLNILKNTSTSSVTNNYPLNILEEKTNTSSVTNGYPLNVLKRKPILHQWQMIILWTSWKPLVFHQWQTIIPWTSWKPLVPHQWQMIIPWTSWKPLMLHEWQKLIAVIFWRPQILHDWQKTACYMIWRLRWYIISNKWRKKNYGDSMLVSSDGNWYVISDKRSSPAKCKG